MTPKISRYMRVPYGVPNGLQVTDEGLWIVDQLTDRLALLALEAPHEYGVSRILRELPTESSNTSGMSFGEGGSGWPRTDPETGGVFRKTPTLQLEGEKSSKSTPRPERPCFGARCPRPAGRMAWTTISWKRVRSG